MYLMELGMCYVKVKYGFGIMIVYDIRVIDVVEWVLFFWEFVRIVKCCFLEIELIREDWRVKWERDK